MRSLSRPGCAVLDAIGKHIPFELTAGFNGRVWVRGATPRKTILLANAIQNAAHLTPTETRHMVRALLTQFNQGDDDDA